ncbi:hypothetical protein [Staphylococcus simulans]|uniref:hypothetical protein n=1 Tax=Staphylococcus simulans TaxID=1286 RepID=UPI003CE8FD63
MTKRTALKPLLNKKVTVTGYIKEIEYKSMIDIDDPSKGNVSILLKPVSISGIEVDHIWLYERNKYYDDFQRLYGKDVKFKANVVAYVKNKKGFILKITE